MKLSFKHFNIAGFTTEDKTAILNVTVNESKYYNAELAVSELKKAGDFIIDQDGNALTIKGSFADMQKLLRLFCYSVKFEYRNPKMTYAEYKKWYTQLKKIILSFPAK